MSTKEDPHIAKASDCEMKAKEPLDLSVRRTSRKKLKMLEVNVLPP